MIQALLWDVDGTLAETERDGHRVAFNLAFEELGVPWRWDEAHYGALLHVAGGLERIRFDMESRSRNPGLPEDPAEREALAVNIHRRKHAFYAHLVASGAVSLRGGVRDLIDEAGARGLRQAIVTTTSRFSVETLLHRHFGGADAIRRFEVMVCGDDVARKKPDPEAYVRALEALGLAPVEALALEDSPAGVAAARDAGIPVVLTRSVYFAGEVGNGTLAAGPGLHVREGWDPPPQPRDGVRGITLDDLLAWRADAHPDPRSAVATPRWSAPTSG
jgi:HAD superfamily hydrolase (TIGR01509 family)